MSMTRTNAKKYVARGVGGQLDSRILDMAEEALQRAFEDWETAKNWGFLLRDTASGFSVAGVSLTSGIAVINAPSSGAFDAVNKLVSVTGTGIQANTTVTDFTRNADGTIASITVSPAPNSTTSSTLSFSGNIPLIAGTNEYNTPTDFRSPYFAQLFGQQLGLGYIQYRYWNRINNDQTVQGLPEAYTVYNPVSAGTQNFGTYRLRVFRTPSGTAGELYDTLFMQYYRSFNRDSDPLDIPNEYLYKFLDYAQWRFFEKKDATNERLPQMEKNALSGLNAAMIDDEEKAEEEEGFRLISQAEMGGRRRELWSNGQFSTYYGEY